MKRLVWGAACAVSALALSILLAYSLLFAGNREAREVVTVPSYVGRQEDAVGPLPGIALEYEYVYSEEENEGEIIAQLPYPGSRRKVKKSELCRVVLTVSLGKKKESLPSLKGKAWNDAKAVLQSMGAKVETDYLTRTDMESGIILSTIPEAGAHIEEGQLVKLYVSRNPIHASVRVPDYTGGYLDIVETQLQADGLLPGGVLEVSSPFPRGMVLKQSLRYGSYVNYQTEIVLTVSCGDNVAENGAEGIKHPFFGDITE